METQFAHFFYQEALRTLILTPPKDPSAKAVRYRDAEMRGLRTMAGRSALCIHFLLCRLMLLGAPGMTLAQQSPLMNRVSSVSPTNYPCAASITMTVIGPGALGQVHQGFGNMPSDVKVRLQGEQAPHHG